MGTSVNHETGIDRISDIPDSVLSLIVSSLPTKYAVRTSILSTRWRYLYTSVSTLDFDDGPFSSDSFLDFVDRVLFFHDMTSIKRFRLRCGGVKTSAHRICNWISFALQRCVPELDIMAWSIEDLSGILPASLFVNETLVKLVLQVSHFVLTIPTKACFPSLKILHLEDVDFADDDSIRRLFSSCPVLEEFSMHSELLRNISEINISSPSLKRLKMVRDADADAYGYEDENYLDIVIDAPSLVDLEFIDIRARSYSLANLHYLVNVRLFYCDLGGQSATKLLEGIDNVQSLCVTPNFLRIFTNCNNPPVFHNLVHLKFCNPVDSSPEGIELTALFASSPNLETLTFDKGVLQDLPSNTTSKTCLLSHLKVIEMCSFDDQIKLVEYFLKNATNLEKFIIRMDRKAMQKFEIAMKLWTLPRESKKCRFDIALQA